MNKNLSEIRQEKHTASQCSYSPGRWAVAEATWIRGREGTPRGGPGAPRRVRVRSWERGKENAAFAGRGSLLRLSLPAIWRLALDRWGFWTQHHGHVFPKV